ncbi:hypothetical protein G3T36_13570 [Diaminobutyricibacter tongyongensis]|uniref:Uncharacterized protein n=1 Tax=Leifsonia tongyongensis TaxID=1268043 RepID=A0A6L9XZS0_9MICO|nr:hypothetical protein [Diaminobutyricibacter tongyongensis]NEN06890.1 hypothetical protein [Diaminobutyricibacter tongyongensis]
MTDGERTLQRLDPIGAMSAWPLGPVTAVVVMAYAVYSTLTHLGQLTNPALAWLALAVIGAAVVYFAVRSRPSVAPFGRRALIVVVGLSTIASTLFTLSVWGRNRILQDDWGQIAVALIFITLPLYRPITEVVTAAVFAALVVGIEAGLEGPSLSIANNPLVYFIVAATPVIALALAGSAYAWVMTADTLRWNEAARESQVRLDPELREGAARIIHQEQVTLLNSGTVPFFADLLARDELSADDIDRARTIAASVRRAAVHDIDRGWLEESVVRSVGHQAPDAVNDPDRLANAMSEEHRGIVGGTIASAARARGFDPASLSIELAAVGGRAHAIMSARIDSPRRELRTSFMPFLAALRAVSSDATLDVQDGSVTLQFSYGES